jgi:hypothetical protein
MKMRQQGWAVFASGAGLVAAGVVGVGALNFYSHLPRAQPIAFVPVAVPVAIAAVPAEPAVVQAPPEPDAATDSGHYAQLRNRLRWVQQRVGSRMLLTPDLHSRMLLAKSAAERAGLSEVGLDFRDVYGLINAETSWVPRRGASRNGTPNLGIAQFEPATAKALGITDPDDVVEAIHGAALHMKEAAEWSRDRIKGLRLAKAERARRLREGVSVYYNLSWKARNEWNGSNTDEMPRETQRHIENARLGAQEALMLEAQLRAGADEDRDAVVTAKRDDGRT